MLNELNLRKFLAPLAARGKAVLRNFALASICALGLSSVAQAQTYVWSGDVTLGAGNTTATGSVGSVNYTISSTAPFQRAQIWNPGTFADTYNVPGDTGGTGGANVYTFNESAGGTYTLTFDRPVESPLIAIASLGQVSQAAVGFDFGSSVDLLWTGTYQAGGSVTPSSGTTTSISGVEGYAVAKYSGTVTSVTFHPNAEPNGSMMVLVGFEVSTTSPTITAPGGTAGDASAALTRPELQTAVGDFDANKAVVWSITGGADQAQFTINSATGVLSFATAPNYSSPTDSGTNNTYEVELTATDLQASPQATTQTVTVTVTPVPTLTSSSPADNATGVSATSDIVLTFSEAIAAGTGNITLYKADGTLVQAFDVTSDVTISGATITLNPTSDLELGASYYVKIDATAVKNLAGNSYAGIADTTTLNFAVAALSSNVVSVAGTTDGVEANNGTAQDGVFTVSMDRTASVATVITYTVGGTATSGSDFTALSGTVTILAGQTSATITVPVLEDDLVEGAETVMLTLTGVTGDSATSLASSPSASITIGDDLIDQIRDQLSDILGSDLARTVDTQSRQFGDMSKAALRRLQEGGEDACGTVQPFDVDGSAALSAGDAQANGSFGSETYDCGTRTHHITTGSFALNTVDGMGTQGMASVVFMTEKMHSDTDLRGKFWGGYLSRNNVSTIADGTITGFGLNGGLYGARQLQDGLFLDYYAALAGGRHQFELIFANATADITAEGDYSYLAAFGGLALSSEKAFERFTLRPRVGVDLAYAKASAASVTATQLTQTDTGEVDVPSYQGVRGFAELVFAFGDDRDATDTFGPLRSYEFAPRLLCQNALDGAGHDCGFGVNVDYLWDAKEEGQRFGVTLDYEHVAESDALLVELRRETAIFDGAGKAVTAVAASSSGNPQFSHTVELSF